MMFIELGKSGMQNNVLGSTRMDNSFIVLPKQRPLAQDIPPRPRGNSVLADVGKSREAMEKYFVLCLSLSLIQVEE